METLWQDIRYGLRMLGKNPGFTVIAIVTLALGIGANTSIFSILDAVLLKPLSFPEPQRIVAIWGTDSKNGETHRPISYPDFADYRNQNRTLESLAAYTDATFTLTRNGEPLRLHGGIVSASLLSVLRVTPEIGPGFMAADDQLGTRVVLLSHSLWTSRFGGDPAVVGRSIVLQARPYKVVGVMPASFQFPLDGEAVDIWTTMAVEMVSDDGDKPITAERGAHYLFGIARLKSNVTLAQANNDAAAISRGLEKLYPGENLHLGLALQTEADALVGDVRESLLLLFCAVGFLLLIACANVANLLLARATGRQQELAVRAAMGASPWRLRGQLLIESVILSLAGGLAGLLLAAWATSFLSTIPSLQIPRLAQARLDWVALLFMTGVSVVTGLAFGLAPAFHFSEFGLSSTLKEGGRTSSGSAGQNRIRSFFVIGEVSLALVLLVGASLLSESLVHLWRTPPGFDPKGVLAFDVDLPNARYPKQEQSIRFYEQLLERIRMVPGVTMASGVLPLPLSDSHIRTTLEIEGRPVAEGEKPRTQIRAIALDYFRTMRIPLLAGREFTSHDDPHSAPVVIVNEAFAKKFFPNENPIGKRVKPEASRAREAPMREIVGVVGNVKHRSLWEPADPESYVSYDQLPIGDMTMVVRTAGDPMALATAIREQVKSLDTELPVYRVRLLEVYVSDSIAQRRFTGVVCSIFAGAGLLLAVVGLYGVMSYLVAQRTHEIGVRVAVGAKQGDIVRLVLRHGMRLSLIGTVLGTIGAMAVSRVIASQLFEVAATDVPTYVAAVLVLMAVAAAACYFPARRATRIDPLVALRYE